jgi:hypothetical protein
MRVAVVGAGALGWAYGARIAKLAGCQVTLVGARAAPARLVRLERVGTMDVLEWTSDVGVDVPEVDLLLSCVRYEHLERMAERVAGVSAPVVILTPMMPNDFARLSARLGAGRLLAAMPSLVAYWSDPDTIRYWIPRAATTRIEGRTPLGVEAELVASLQRAGIASKLDRHVLERNVATTVSFLPLAIGIDIANGAGPMLRDGPLLALALEAAVEGRELGSNVGTLESWASMMTRFMSPFTLKMGVGIVRSRAPEVLQYVDEHFGRKLHVQNVAMAQAMVQLAREKGVKRSALEKLVLLLRSPGSP